MRKKFVIGEILVFVRKLNANDVRCLLEMGEARGFPGMMASIVYIHW